MPVEITGVMHGPLVDHEL